MTLGEMLTVAHRGQVDCCVPGGLSVSQSSSSVMFDGSGQPDGERIVDHSRKSGVTFNVISAHSNFSEDIQTERMVDRSGKPDERNSSNAQIRTLLEEQRQTTLAECREKVGHHELQAAHAVEIPTLPVDQCHSHLIRYLKGVETFFRIAEPERRAAKHLGHTW